MIHLVVQWRMTCDLNTLWQRFGRAVRDLSQRGVAIFIVEPKYFDEEKQKAVERAEKSKENKVAQKRKATEDAAESRATKIARPAAASIVDSGDHRGGINDGAQVGSGNSIGLEVRREQADGDVNDSHRRDCDNGVDSVSNERVALQDVTHHVPNTSDPVKSDIIDLGAMRAQFEEDRRPRGAQVKKQRMEDKMSPEMDALINAATRPFRCYRAPIMAFYKNDKTGMLCPYLPPWASTSRGPTLTIPTSRRPLRMPPRPS